MYINYNNDYLLYFGKFSVSWTGNNSSHDYLKLAPWLGASTTTLDGISLLGLFQGALAGENDVQLCNTYTYTYNYSGSMPNTCQLHWRVSNQRFSYYLRAGHKFC